VFIRVFCGAAHKGGPMGKKEDSAVEVEERDEELKQDPEEHSYPWHQQLL
jgi:hypothetical protein